MRNRDLFVRFRKWNLQQEDKELPNFKFLDYFQPLFFSSQTQSTVCICAPNFGGVLRARGKKEISSFHSMGEKCLWDSPSCPEVVASWRKSFFLAGASFFPGEWEWDTRTHTLRRERLFLQTFIRHSKGFLSSLWPSERVTSLGKSEIWRTKGELSRKGKIEDISTLFFAAVLIFSRKKYELKIVILHPVTSYEKYCFISPPEKKMSRVKWISQKN